MHLKVFLKVFLIVIINSLWLYEISCISDPKPKKSPFRDKYVNSKPVKKASYQVQEKSKTVGYVHEYEVETLENNYQYYMVYDLEGNIVGYIAPDGIVEKYHFNGQKQVLGYFELNSALARLLNISNAQIYSVRLEDVPYLTSEERVNLIKKEISSSSNNSSKEASPKIPNPTSEDFDR